ncbi:MAG: DUF4214 domain-containing protein [Desulfobulbus sp.]|nr:DUF4214 domain-containing protein [Desulfobulbus sp.]
MPHLTEQNMQYASDYGHLPADADVFPAHPYALEIDLARGQITTYWQADPVTEAYVAYLGRPGDPAGVAYWSQLVATPSVIFESFSRSDEYRSLVADKTHFQIVDSLYHVLFNRAPDEGGQAYWTARLDAGDISIDDLAPALMYGATGRDSDTLAAKIWAAQDFTLALDTGPERQAYEQATAQQGEQIKVWLAGIGSPDGYDVPSHDLVAAGIQPLIDQVLL